jgi:hypothetical protein
LAARNYLGPTMRVFRIYIPELDLRPGLHYQLAPQFFHCASFYTG